MPYRVCLYQARARFGPCRASLRDKFVPPLPPAGEGWGEGKLASASQLSPHPALRATFSRTREKGKSKLALEPMHYALPGSAYTRQGCGYRVACVILAAAVQQQTNTGCMDGIADHVRQSRHVLGQTDADRQVEDFFCQLHDAFHLDAPPVNTMPAATRLS